MICSIEYCRACILSEMSSLHVVMNICCLRPGTTKTSTSASIFTDTVSNAAAKSMATHTVRSGDFSWLKPVSMSVVSWSVADVVECLGLKPC